jgi:hypothetical protein
MRAPEIQDTTGRSDIKVETEENRKKSRIGHMDPFTSWVTLSGYVIGM